MEDNQSQMNYQQIEHHQSHPEQTRPIYGNNIVICHPECMLGPQYYVFIPTFVCVSALLIILYANVKDIISPIWNVILLVAIVILMVSYLLIGFSNPGIVINKRQDEANHQTDKKYCQQCGVIRPFQSRHCKDCNCCIQGHDHHCPWIGKCVGQSNKGRFYFFLTMMFGTLMLFFVATLSSAAAHQ